MKGSALFIRSIKRLPQVLLHPAHYFAEENDIWLDGAIAIALLFLVTLLQKLAWQEVPGEAAPFGTAASQSALNTVMVWTGFFGIYYLFMIVFKKRTYLPDLLGAAGSASMPLIITTIISVISWWIGSSIGISVIMPAWIWAQNVLGWIGLALSWPGWMGYFVLRYKLQLPGKWPLILPALVLAIFFAGWLIPQLLH
jgi:hypothetical protein